MHQPTDLDSLTTSGDAALDRRFSYAVQLAERGDLRAGIDLLDQCAEIDPHWPPQHFQRGIYYQELRERDAAIAAYTDYLRLDPADRMGASIKLALLGAMPAPAQLPDEYVRALFDQYAPRFDSALVETLAYNVPQQLYELIGDIRPADSRGERILDLGCGTGLAGERFARRAACLDGVDLSPGMIAQAAAKQIYNKLDTADLSAYLAAPPSLPYDIVLAADVFVYLGALDGLIPQIAAYLAPGGLFAFSVQKGTGDSYQLGADHRFAHSAAYIERLAAAAGLRVRLLREDTLREDAGQPIIGYLVIAEKPAAALGTALAMLQDGEVDEPQSPPLEIQ